MKVRKIFKKPQIKIVNNLYNIILKQKEQEEEELQIENNKRYPYPNPKESIALTLPINNRQSLNPIQLKKSLRVPTQKSTAIPDKKEKDKKDKDVIVSVNKGHKEVLTFLQELNMGEFFENFINNGIINGEKLFYLNNDNLKLIQIPYAYRLRFLKKLKEIKNIESMKKSINEKGRLSKIKLKRDKNESKYEEIFIPKEEDDKEVSHEEMRKTFTQAIYDFQKTHSKFNFENNENDNEDDINENIDNNFSANSSNINSFETKTNTNNNKTSNEISNSKIDSEIQNTEQPVEIGEYIENKKNGQNNKIKELLPLHCKKILCYQCWNVILRKNTFVKYGKPFCSLKCFDLYENINFTKCKTCLKKIKFIDSLPSYYDRKAYYCSLECLAKLEPERKNWMKKNLVDDDNISVSSSKSNVSERQIDILDL